MGHTTCSGPLPFPFVLSLWAGSCSHTHLLPNKGLLLVGTTGVQQVV